METKIIFTEKVKLKKPVLVEGLPGIGNVGRVAAAYIVSQLKMKKFAEIYSPHFLPLVILHNSIAQPLKGEFYYHKGKANDIIVFTGDMQSTSNEGHYKITEKVLEFSEKMNVQLILTIGGFAEGHALKEPKVVGAVNNEKLIKRFDKYDVDFKDRSVGTVVGASGLLTGFSKIYNIDSLCLLGQTAGFPMITDPLAAEKVLKILTKILNIKIDMTKIEDIVRTMESHIQTVDDVYKTIAEKTKAGEHTSYIG